VGINACNSIWAANLEVSVLRNESAMIEARSRRTSAKQESKMRKKMRARARSDIEDAPQCAAGASYELQQQHHSYFP